jgi:hypothetical protein
VAGDDAAERAGEEADAVRRERGDEGHGRCLLGEERRAEES